MPPSAEISLWPILTAGGHDHVHRHDRHDRLGRANRQDFVRGIPCSWQSSRQWRLARWECCENRCVASRRPLHHARRHARHRHRNRARRRHHACHSPAGPGPRHRLHPPPRPAPLRRCRNRSRRHPWRFFPHSRFVAKLIAEASLSTTATTPAPLRPFVLGPIFFRSFLHRVIGAGFHALADDFVARGFLAGPAGSTTFGFFILTPIFSPRKRGNVVAAPATSAATATATRSSLFRRAFLIGGLPASLGRGGSFCRLLIAELVGRLVHDVERLLRFERLRLGCRRLQFVPYRHRHFRFHNHLWPLGTQVNRLGFAWPFCFCRGRRRLLAGPHPARLRHRVAIDTALSWPRLCGGRRSDCGGRRRWRRDHNPQIARQLLPSRGTGRTTRRMRRLGRRSECGQWRRGRWRRLFRHTSFRGFRGRPCRRCRRPCRRCRRLCRRCRRLCRRCRRLCRRCRLGLFRRRFSSKIARQGCPMIRLFWFGHDWFADNSTGNRVKCLRVAINPARQAR